MKPKEKEFCRLTAICGDPERAAREAGYRSADKWRRLICRADIAGEIRKNASTLRSIYRDTAMCGLYRMAFGKQSDALKLLYRANPSDKELEAMDLTSVAEIKRTKEKSVEIKFFERVKAAEKLNTLFNSSEELNSSGGLIEAMTLAAQALGHSTGSEGDKDGD